MWLFSDMDEINYARGKFVHMHNHGLVNNYELFYISTSGHHYNPTCISHKVVIRNPGELPLGFHTKLFNPCVACWKVNIGSFIYIYIIYIYILLLLKMVSWLYVELKHQSSGSRKMTFCTKQMSTAPLRRGSHFRFCFGQKVVFRLPDDWCFNTPMKPCCIHDLSCTLSITVVIIRACACWAEK